VDVVDAGKDQCVHDRDRGCVACAYRGAEACAGLDAVGGAGMGFPAAAGPSPAVQAVCGDEYAFSFSAGEGVYKRAV